MVKIPSLEEMLEHGVHFGHKSGRWHPKMKPFIFGERSGIHIINLEATAQALQKALAFIQGIVGRGGVVLFVGTKRQAQSIVIEAAERCGMPHVTGRWLGGTITNFVEIKKVLRRLKDLKVQRESGALKKYTKFEQLEFTREIAELEAKVGGIQNLEKRPEALFVVDTRHEKTAVHEAQAIATPIVAMCDTNTKPEGITYVIPSNDDAVKSIRLIAGLVADAVLEGKSDFEKAEASKHNELKSKQIADLPEASVFPSVAHSPLIKEPLTVAPTVVEPETIS